jgi:hypothetical protein
MSKKILFLLVFVSSFSFAQVGIGTTTPNANAMLEVVSSNKGVLIPRMTTSQRTAIVTPAQSLLVYDTDVSMYYYYSTSNNGWTAINVGSIKSLTTSYTLIPSDSGRMIDIDSASAVTLTIPDNLPIGFQVSVTQTGLGGISIVGGGSMVVNNRWGGTRSIGRWSKIGIEVRAINSSVISGDLQ